MKRTRIVVAALATFALSIGKMTSKLHAEPVPAERLDPSFRRHVVPLLGRAGCSGRACHGSFKGQGGFRLSLFGYDFSADHRALLEGDQPRIDVDNPAESLLLLKPTLGVKHRGEKRLEKGSWQYDLIRKWIAAGAVDDSKSGAEFDRLEVFPNEIRFEKVGERVPLQVIAHWTDGSSEDVTKLSRFRTNDEAVANINAEGVVESLGTGDSHVVAFYDNGVTPVPVMRPVSDRIGEDYPELATRTRVDELIAKKLRKVGIVPSEFCGDAEFLRRLRVDLTGTLPTPDEVEAFLADVSEDKRARKIDELLATPEYAAWWTTKLCDLTGNNPRQTGDKLFREEISKQWYDWIFRRVRENTPYDELVAGIVLATGRREGQSYEEYNAEMTSYLRRDNPADFSERDTMPHYWARKNLRKPEEKALSFSHAFLGVRLQCAQCHKHPFDQWSQEDFRHFQAFFDPIRYGGGKNSKAMTMGMMATLEGQMEKPEGPKARQMMKKQLYELMKERVADGKSIPWEEVWIVAPKPQENDAQKRRPNKKRKKGRYSGRVVTPKLLGGDEVNLVAAQETDSRVPLMDWLRDPNNPYFAHAFVNRAWANYFGRGIVEPADDMNLANPPSNRALLDYLADGFIERGFDMKWLHREIVSSDAYQRSWRPNETNRLDERNFSRRVLRRLPAEVTWDAIVQATSSSAKLASFPSTLDSRAIGPVVGVSKKSKLRRGGLYALEIFGKPARETTCDCERTDDPTLLQTIFTRNDREIWQLIDAKDGWLGGFAEIDRQRTQKLRKLIQDDRRRAARERARRKRGANQKREPGENEAKRLAKLRKNLPPLPDAETLIREAFLRTVSRPPSQGELETALTDIEAAESPLRGLRDLLWALLNTKEFIVNH